MKNNKGYTLVELLVTLAVFAIIMAEVGSMMMNSSMLYRNGTYEVELQTEAQQIVQQMEELLIDVTNSVSTNYQPSLSSDFITISNNTGGISGNGVSTIYYFTVDKDPNLGYGNLYYSKSSSDGSASVNQILMAEYVQSISLNMEAYTSDVVTLNVSMNNGRYGYQASQDIYLRNGVGSGGGGNYNNNAEYDVEIVVLRYKEYDLDDYVISDKPGETFTYAWDTSDSVKYAAANVNYVLSGDSLKLSAVWNQKANWYRNDQPGPYKLIATGNMGSTVKISVRTDKVGYGSDDHALFYQNVDSSYTTMTPVPVYGIDVTEADHITVEMAYNNGTNDVKTLIFEDGSVIVGNPQATYYFPLEGPGARIEMSFQNVTFNQNGNDNTIEVFSDYMQDNQMINHNAGVLSGYGYYEYIRDSGKTIYFKVTLSYGNGANPDKEEINIHMLPAPVWTDSNHKYPPLNADFVPDEVAENFWSAVGF